MTTGHDTGPASGPSPESGPNTGSGDDRTDRTARAYRAARADRDDLWNFDLQGHPGLGSLTGYTVRASDGRVGRVLHTVDDPTTGLLVVNTAPWFFGKLLAVPAGLIAAVDDDSGTVRLRCGKRRLKEAPAYQADSPGALADYRQQAHRYFTEADRSDRLAG
jgi:hypothetical protein